MFKYNPEPEFKKQNLLQLIGLYALSERRELERQKTLVPKMQITDKLYFEFIKNLFANYTYAGFSIYKCHFSDIKLNGWLGVESFNKISDVKHYQNRIEFEREQFKEKFITKFLPAMKPEFTIKKIFSKWYWNYLYVWYKWNKKLGLSQL